MVLRVTKAAGFEVPENTKFIFVIGDGIGKEHLFSSEKLTTLLAVHKYEGWPDALQKMKQIFEGRGVFILSRSVGILSHAWEQKQQGGRIKGPMPKTIPYRYTGHERRDVPDMTAGDEPVA